MEGISGKRILVTGGTGSIGAHLVRQCLEAGAAHVTVFSRDDSKHFYLQRALEGAPVSFVIGDVRDAESVARAFLRPVDIVLHAAALKHVAICEDNPTEAVKTNILGTQVVIDAARRAGAKRFVLVSTDKAVDPANTMGATKHLAEKLTLGSDDASTGDEASAGGLRCVCVRFGNVLGTRGSVIPAFDRAIADHGRIRVSDPEVTRFAITPEEAAALVLEAASRPGGGLVYVLPMRAFRLADVVEAFQSLSDFEVDILGMDEYEKRHEELVGSHERGRTSLENGLYVVHPPGTKVQAADHANSSQDAPLFTVDDLSAYVRDWRQRNREQS